MQDLYDAQKKLGKRQVHHFLKFFRYGEKRFSVESTLPFCLIFDFHICHLTSFMFEILVIFVGVPSLVVMRSLPVRLEAFLDEKRGFHFSRIEIAGFHFSRFSFFM